MKNLTKVLGVTAMVLASTITPCLALDYEAKPVNWVLQSPIRLVGALTGVVVSGGFMGPVNHGYGGFVKGTHHWAEKFGDEKGMGQNMAAAPTGGVGGIIVGSGYGVLSGIKNGWRQGWEKPFSRWSYLNVYEEGK